MKVEGREALGGETAGVRAWGYRCRRRIESTCSRSSVAPDPERRDPATRTISRVRTQDYCVVVVQVEIPFLPFLLSPSASGPPPPAALPYSLR